MDKIRLLFVIDHLKGGGAEGQLVELLNAINRKEFIISLFLTEGGGVRIKKLKDDIEIYGFLEENKRKTLKAIYKLRNTIKNIKPDIVISWLEYSTFITSLSNLEFKLKHIAGIWGNLDYIYSQEVRWGFIKKLLLRFAYRKADMLIFNSYNVAEKSKWLGNKKYRVIYNLFNTEKVNKLKNKTELKSHLQLNKDLFYILFVGSLVKRKGVDLLIKAFKELDDKKLRLLIIGKGELENKLRTIAGDDKRIEFLGYKENVLSYIKASELLILPSLSEGIPNVIVEALACSTPVIATEIDGIPEIIKDKHSGLLIKPGSIQTIKEAIEYAVKNYSEMEKMAKEGRKILELFDKQRIISEFERVFREVAL